MLKLQYILQSLRRNKRDRELCNTRLMLLRFGEFPFTKGCQLQNEWEININLAKAVTVDVRDD